MQLHFNHFKGTPLVSGLVVKDTKNKYQNLFCDIPICDLKIWQFGLQLDVSVEQDNAFKRSSKINRYNKSLKYISNHIKVTQYQLLCPTHVDNKKKQVFKKHRFEVCYKTRAQCNPFKHADMS